MEHIIWNKKAECASREEIKTIQLAKLQDTVKRCYENVPMYKKKFDAVGLKPEHIKTLKDIELIPFTTKDDFRDNYPFNMFAVPRESISRIHASSGTTGKPTVVGYTKNDLAKWAEMMSRICCAAGAVPSDIAQIAFGYGLFTGAFGLHMGLENMGCGIVPTSSGNTKRQLMLMQDFGTNLLISTPSYAMHMGEVAMEMGIDTAKLPLRVGLFGGEGHTESMRAELEKAWNFTSTENYGLSETGGPGFSGECYKKTGMHIATDMYIPEIVDPDTGKAVAEGEHGEMIITAIDKECLPVLRYRTKDISWLDHAPCSCGRTSTRMGKIQGRTDDMMIISGVNVFPSQIENVVVGMEEISPNYEIILRKKGRMDKIEVRLEVVDGGILDSYNKLEELKARVQANLFSVLNIHVKITLVSPNTLERFEGKAKRIKDLREE